MSVCSLLLKSRGLCPSQSVKWKYQQAVPIDVKGSTIRVRVNLLPKSLQDRWVTAQSFLARGFKWPFLISEEKLEVQPEFEPPLDFYQRSFLWWTWSKLPEKVNIQDQERGSKVKRRVSLVWYSLAAFCLVSGDKRNKNLCLTRVIFHVTSPWQVPGLPCQEPMPIAHTTAIYKYSITDHRFSIILYPKQNSLFLLICRCLIFTVRGPKVLRALPLCCCTKAGRRGGEQPIPTPARLTVTLLLKPTCVSVREATVVVLSVTVCTTN